MRRTIRYITVFLPLIYVAVIWRVSSMPSNTYVKFGLSFDDFLREALHFIEFGILFWLLLASFWALGKTSKTVEYISIIIALTYSMVDEIHQSFIPYRTASIIDFIKDITGVFVSYGFYHYFSLNGESLIGRALRCLRNILGKSD